MSQAMQIKDTVAISQSHLQIITTRTIVINENMIASNNKCSSSIDNIISRSRTTCNTVIATTSPRNSSIAATTTIMRKYPITTNIVQLSQTYPLIILTLHLIMTTCRNRLSSSICTRTHICLSTMLSLASTPFCCSL